MLGAGTAEMRLEAEEVKAGEALRRYRGSACLVGCYLGVAGKTSESAPMAETNPVVVAVGTKKARERSGRRLDWRLRLHSCVGGREIGAGALIGLIAWIVILVLRLMWKMRSARRGSLLRCCR